MLNKYNPLVTVITPVYNCQDYIDETIASVLSQDYPNKQYIVINDGSTDGSEEVIERFWNDKVMIIHQDNRGEQFTVNRALDMVEGKYFMIVNADDPLIYDDCISRMVKAMEEHPDVLCAYPDWTMIDGDGYLLQHMKMREYDFPFMVRHHWCLPSVGAIFRSSVIKDVGYRDNSFHWCSDFDYWLRVGLAGPMLHVPEELATWRKIPGQLSAKPNKERASERIRLMEKFFSLPGITPEIRKLQPQAMSWSAMVAASLSPTFGDKLTYIGKALRYYPGQLLSTDFWHPLAKYGLYYAKRYLL